MAYSIRANAHAVLFPAFADTELSDGVKRFLSQGGCSILLGETRQEYVARDMAGERKQNETAETFQAITREAKSLGGDLLVAVDQEIAGICRLHGLVPPFPPRERIGGQDEAAFEALCAEIAGAAKLLGVNCFLAPILDVVTGGNPWLRNRTWSTDAAAIGRLSSAYVRGVQSRGVAATAKHFPGYPRIELDPAEEAGARMNERREAVENCLVPFAEAIRNKVEIVMTGPAIVEALDPENPASLSPAIIGLLRENLGFPGLVMSDDLDAPATLRGRPITQVAVDALNAGADLLLIANTGNQIDRIAQAIAGAVGSGDLSEARLAQAAAIVRALAVKYGC